MRQIAGCWSNACPAVYETDERGSHLVQGAISTEIEAPEGMTVVEVPAELVREWVEADDLER